MSISSGDDYLRLKNIFSEVFRTDSKFPESDDHGRTTIAPSVTFSVHDNQLNYRENITNLNADHDSFQPVLPLSVLKMSTNSMMIMPLFSFG